MDHTLTLPADPAMGAAAAGPTPGYSAPPAAVQTLAVPSVAQPWRYAWASAQLALWGLTRPHRMQPRRAGHYGAAAPVGLGLNNRWRAVFDVPARAAAAVPLSTHHSVGRLLRARLFADLGLKAGQLRHLQHRSVHPAGVAACASARQPQLDCHVPRVLRLGEECALVEVRTRVTSADGAVLALLDDGYIVRGLAAADLAALPPDPAGLRKLLGLRKRLPHLSTTRGEALVCQMPVPPDMGRAYGRISGDWHPAHMGLLGAWLSGLQRPCLQTLALRNLVLRHLAELAVPMACLELSFAAPADLGQSLQLVVDDGALEVLDAQGRLVAYGTAGGARAVDAQRGAGGDAAVSTAACAHALAA